jgi:hypothetical protein
VFAANDEVILAAKLVRHVIERGAHGASVFRGFEVDEGFIAEVALGRTRLNFGGESYGSHDFLIVVRNAWNGHGGLAAKRW